jgi:hypothetical protein
MPRQISSRATLFYKVSGVVWIAGFCAGTLVIFLAKMHPDPPGFFYWLFPLTTVAGSLLWMRVFRFKKVALDGEFLVISNSGHELRVPLAEVARISYPRWYDPAPITLVFTRDLGFGNVVTFLPRLRILLPWQEHPLVSELRELTKPATRSNLN